MDWVQILTLVLSSSGGTVIITKLIEKLPGVFSGQSDRRRAEVDRAIREKTKAIRCRDREAARRRVYAEALSLHRRRMYEAPCIDPRDTPPWPEYPVSDDHQPTAE